MDPRSVDHDGPAIRNVSDTALWVAVYRALESERPDALFRDPWARRLAGERGRAIVEALPFGRSMGWSMVVRTAVMDEVILRCVDRGARTVLNLGAGLDTRAFRLALPTALRWLDVDLPDVVAHRRACLGTAVAACRQRHVEADLRNADERRRVFAEAALEGPVLVVTEGLLIYLEPGQVADLARQLRAEPAMRWWLADQTAPALQQTMGLVWRTQLDAADAAFRFAPEDPKAFFGALDWRESEFHSSWTDAIRLRRAAPNAWLWDPWRPWWPSAAERALKRMSGVMLLEPGA